MTIAGLIALTLLIASYFGMTAPIQKITAFFLSPLQTFMIKRGAATNSLVQSTTQSKQELVKKNEKLEKEVRDLTYELISSKHLRRENQQLRSLLQFKEENSHSLLVAQVIYKRNILGEKSIVINKGSNDGVKTGRAVLIDGGTLIGTIKAVHPHDASVELTVDQDSSIVATVDDGKRPISGVVTGAQGGGLQMELIPKDIPVAVGQKVITNGLQEEIPGQLFIGEIASVQENENGIFHTALLEPPYFIEDLIVIAVLVQ
jgi:rod shape-determining protein MreC